MYEWAVWPQAIEMKVDVDELRNIPPISYLFVTKTTTETTNKETSKFSIRIIQNYHNIYRRSDG